MPMLRGVAATKSSVPLLRMLQLIRFPGGLITRLPPLLSWLGAFRGAWEADKILPFSGRMTSPKILFSFLPYWAHGSPCAWRRAEPRSLSKKGEWIT